MTVRNSSLKSAIKIGRDTSIAVRSHEKVNAIYQITLAINNPAFLASRIIISMAPDVINTKKPPVAKNSACRCFDSS